MGHVKFLSLENTNVVKICTCIDVIFNRKLEREITIQKCNNRHKVDIIEKRKIKRIYH